MRKGIGSKSRVGATGYKVQLPVSFFREGRMIVAYCPLLDLSTCGRTLREAEKAFEEALALFMEEVIRRGTLAEALRELGWKWDRIGNTRVVRPPDWKLDDNLRRCVAIRSKTVDLPSLSA